MWGKGIGGSRIGGEPRKAFRVEHQDQAALRQDDLSWSHVSDWVTIFLCASLGSNSCILEDGPEICDPELPEEDYGEVLTRMHGPGTESLEQSRLGGRAGEELKIREDRLA
jgi:hypothetical protein